MLKSQQRHALAGLITLLLQFADRACPSSENVTTTGEMEQNVEPSTLLSLTDLHIYNGSTDYSDVLPTVWNTIKSVVLHLLSIVIRDVREEQCYGCFVQHPSQTRHHCLRPLPEYFVFQNHQELIHRLLNERFPAAASHVLSVQCPMEHQYSHTVIREIAGIVLRELE